MAETELSAVADEVEAEIKETRVACFHRIGDLDVGDAAVVCAASSPHRDEAFTACRLLIDRVKARVPIWKRRARPRRSALGRLEGRTHGGLKSENDPGAKAAHPRTSQGD